jgi:hypothetical protein
MMRKSLALALILILAASISWATPRPTPLSGTLATLPTFDTFNDTIKYDDNVIAWWYGGLTNFRLATKFTPLVTFKLQQFYFAMSGTSSVPVNLYVKNDSSGFPGGTPLWSGTLAYTMANTWRGVYIDSLNLPQYTFAAGSNFWLEIRSNGPPYESYDNSPVNPTRSKTYYAPAPFNGWVDSPGDNFIRAIGMYSGQITDVGCDSLMHGQNFHLPNPGTLQLSGRIRNYGLTAQTFQVACSLFTELGGSNYQFFSALTPQTITAPPAVPVTVTFPSTTIPTSNRYKFRVRTMLAGDQNPDNNWKETESQIYTAPAELRYDDTLFASAAYISEIGGGWAMKFNPHQAGNYTITQVRFNVDATVGDSSARVQILDDNGTLGAPNTVLWQQVQHMVAGWNSFTVNIPSQTGSFYVAYLFEYGPQTSAMRLDNPPASGQVWQKSASVWAPTPQADDFMIRASISAGGTTAPVHVTLTPIGAPITIPAGGGTYSYNAQAQNMTTAAQAFRAWCKIKYPNGTWTGYVLGPLNLNIPASYTVSRQRNQDVPGSWAAGAYQHWAWVAPTGTFNAYDSTYFGWTKSGVDVNSPLKSWAGSGELFPGEQAQTTSIPSGAELTVSPNPFNPITTLSFTLPEVTTVTLKVYDLQGNVAATLVDGLRDAGQHRVTFDGSNLASGVYFYRLLAGNTTLTGKLMLLK